MKTIIRKVNFRYFFRRSLYLLVISFLLAGCEEEASLSARSVVEAGETERERADLDKWILDTFTRPYGIEVEYRWNKNAVQNGSYIYPPEVANVKSVLNTIKTLWIDLYTAPELGGDKFLLGKNPLKIYMYGGRNVDGNGMELLDNLEATTNEMFLYNVNEFNPQDEDKVFILMRSVHHQFARHLMELSPMTEANSYPSAETSISNRLNLLHGFSKERRKGAEGLFWLVIRIRKVSLPFILSFHLKKILRR